MCLEARAHAAIAAGTMPLSEQDRIVLPHADKGAADGPGLGWALRGAVLLAAYSTFWTERARRNLFPRRR